MKKIEPKHIVAIIISLIIGFSVVGYGYLNYKAKRESLNQELYNDLSKSLQDKQSQKQLQVCLDEVNERINKTINSKVKASDEAIKFAFNLFQEQKDECFKKYPQK